MSNGNRASSYNMQISSNQKVASTNDS